MGRDRVATIEVSGGRGKIVERLPSVQIRVLTELCSYTVTTFRTNDWDGRVELFHARRRSFPVGLLPRVVEILQGHRFDVSIVSLDKMLVRPVDFKTNFSKYGDRWYQTDVKEKALDRGMGVIQLATGGGKTLVSAKIIAALGLPTLFLVHTKDLLYQAIDVFSGIFGADSVGQVGDRRAVVKDITVATFQTIARVLDCRYYDYEFEDVDSWGDDETDTSDPMILEWLDSVGVVFVDECHRVAAPSVTEIMGKLYNPPHRFGLSASPWRDDGADMAIEASLGPVISRITASDLTSMGFLVPATIRMMPVPEMNGVPPSMYDSMYKKYIVENEVRNTIGVRRAVSMVHQGKPTLILVRHIKHGNIIQKMVSEQMGTWVPFLSGKDSSITRRSVLDDMRRDRCGIFVASTIADEGLDLKPLQGLVLLGGGKSSVKALQRVGRTLRPYKNKTRAEIVDFEDNARWLFDHSIARAKLYSTESAWTVLDW